MVVAGERGWNTAAMSGTNAATARTRVSIKKSGCEHYLLAARRCRAFPAWLPDYLEADLHLARVARASGLPEGRRNCGTGDRRSRGSVSSVERRRRRIHRVVESSAAVTAQEIRAVVEVEDVPAELELDASRQGEVLVKRRVDLEVPRPVAVAAPGGAHRADLEPA